MATHNKIHKSGCQFVPFGLLLVCLHKNFCGPCESNKNNLLLLLIFFFFFMKTKLY
jgi:hypothetical protein